MDKTQKHLNGAAMVSTIALLGISALSYFSFRYFHWYGHIEGVLGALFVLVQWTKLAALVMIPASFFLKTERFLFAIKWFVIPAAVVSLCFTPYYMAVEFTPVHAHQALYPALVNFMPDALVLTLFVLEAVVMTAAAVLAVLCAPSRFVGCRTLRQTVRFSRPLGSIRAFLWVMLAVLPLSLLDNLVRLLPQDGWLYRFLWFDNFTIWHALAFSGVFAATYACYRFLKPKSIESRHRYMFVLALATMVQYFSKASRLLGDGYNVYFTVIAFIPLFICNIGIPVAALAVFTRNRTLRDISFFVHAAGALTVFFYFGKSEMSNYGTIFNYSFLYFALTHAALYALCMMPVLLGEHTFTRKRALIPMVYYAIVIAVAAVSSEFITTITSNLYGAENAIRPNYAFSQNCPIPVPYPDFSIVVLGMRFNLFYLTALFLVYVAIFFVHYGGFLFIKRLSNKLLSQKMHKTEEA